jgi:hypothetical protein
MEVVKMRGRQIVGRLVAALVALFALGVFAVSPAAAADGDTLEIDLNGLNDYDFNGTATITEENGAVTVEIQVEGEDVVGGHPVHIHLGTCNELDPNPTYSLADIDANGQSSTLVDGVTLDDLLAEPYAVNAHLSATDIPTYVTCGDIAPASEGDDEEATDEEAAPADDATEDEGAEDEAAEDEAVAEATPAAVGGGDTGGAVTNVPASGVGSAVRGQADMSAFLTIVGSLAVLLVVAGVTVRMREERARK